MDDDVASNITQALPHPRPGCSGNIEYSHTQHTLTISTTRPRGIKRVALHAST